MTLENKIFEIEELKADDADGLLTFEGYAAAFNNVDSQKDIILPGAFTKSIASRGDEIVLLWQHDTREPIGKGQIREDKRGLFLKGTLSRTDAGVKAHTLLKDGVIRQMSIGYSPKDWEIDPKKGVRQLKEVALWEASLVTFPANDKATITNVKSLEGVPFEELHEHKRMVEAALRDAGASDQMATYVASLIPKPAPRDAGGAELIASIANATNILKGFTA
jgi:HK97 family phage prohead protease